MTDTPRCSRCGFNIETAKFRWSTQPMLHVQPTKPVHRDEHFGSRVAAGPPVWVCGHCHAPFEEVLEIVKRGSGLAPAPDEPGIVQRARKQGLV